MVQEGKEDLAGLLDIDKLLKNRAMGNFIKENEGEDVPEDELSVSIDKSKSAICAPENDISHNASVSRRHGRHTSNKSSLDLRLRRPTDVADIKVSSFKTQN